MGCCNSKSDDSNTKNTKTAAKYSWDNRKQIDLSQYIIDGAENTVVVKRPGSIDGQQFVIQNCKNSKIFLLDHIATVTVDDCVECQIIIGPTNGSIFFRDCKECKCILACQQFRSRDTKKSDFYIHCTTQPIIESSCDLRFGCYQLFYNGLAQDFKSAGLNIFNNNWSSIYDFSPDVQQNNWSFIPEDVQINSLMNLDYNDDDQQSPHEMGNGDTKLIPIRPLELGFFPNVVPLTRGKREKLYFESCFVVVLHHEKSAELALRYLEKIADKSEIDVIQTKQILLSPDDAARIFGSSSRLWEAAKNGPLIGLEFNGDDCIRICAEIVSLLQTPERHFYSSPSTEVATREIENFYNFCDMQMKR